MFQSYRKLISAGFIILLSAMLQPATLKEMYAAAGPAAGFNRYIELSAGTIYTGGLLIGRIYDPVIAEFIGEDESVRIAGNGAILDLQGEQICISYTNGALDIDDCVVINGNIRYRGMEDDNFSALPVGSVRYVTMYQPHDFGIRLHNCGEGITIHHNIIVDAIDTGYDFISYSGFDNSWLPTGVNVAASGQYSQMGVLPVTDNWSYHSDPEANTDMMRHIGFL